MPIPESLTTSLMLNLTTNTSSSPSLTCQSIPEVTLIFLKSCPCLASSCFSSGSCSMDFGEDFSSCSHAVCVRLTGLYMLYGLLVTSPPGESRRHKPRYRLCDGDLQVQSCAPPALLSLEQKPSLSLVSSYYGCQFKL